MLRTSLSRRGLRNPRFHQRQPAAVAIEQIKRDVCRMEWLEERALFAFPPEPIVPKNNGEINQLAQALKKAAAGQLNALDNFPVPFSVVASAGGAAPVVFNSSASKAFAKIDADRSKATGKGGNDIEVSVQTVLSPTPHLSMTINRLDGAPFASDLEVLIAFPFDAFNSEIGLPGDPNLFIGYKTSAANGATGGIAPLSETIKLIPHTLAGDDHTVELQFNTTGASNPLRFITGHFDGTNLTGILNTAAYTAYVETPPQNLSIGLGVGQNGLFSGLTEMAFDMTWDASSPTKAEFAYLEEESGNGSDADFNTTITVDQMPTHEHLRLSLDEASKALTLSHRANAVIGKLQVVSERNDGLKIIGTATDVPTELDLSLATDGKATLNVNANTLDLQLEAIQEGGFDGTDAFFGYKIGYASIKGTNMPDLTAGYDAATSSFTVGATNPGESIGAVELVIGDDANLELPPSYNDLPAHHLFSVVDDGTHGTIVARVVHLQSATLNLDPNASQNFTMTLGQAAPAQLYLRTLPASNLVPGHDAEVTADIDVIPRGTISFNLEVPGKFGYVITPLPGDPPTGIGSIHVFGHFDSINFDVEAGGLPPIFNYDFDPDSHLTVLAELTPGVPSQVGKLAIRLWDATGLNGTAGLFGAEIKDARARVDNTPSFHGTWSDGANTAVNFNTDANNAFLGGAQFLVSTAVDLAAPLPVGNASAKHYLKLKDAGAGGNKQLGAGAFGIDEFSYSSNDAVRQLSLHYDANQDHGMDLDVDTAFGGRFFPNYQIDVNGLVDDVPQLWDVSSNLATTFDYTASDGIAGISLLGHIDDNSGDGAGNGTDLNVLAAGLPSEVHFLLDPAASVALNMNAALSLISVQMSSTTSIFGSGFQLLKASVQDVPARLSANWAGDDIVAETKDAVGNPAPAGAVSAMISKSSNAATNAAKLAPFGLVAPGDMKINYSPFLQRVDERAWNAGIGSPPSGVLSRLDQIYGDGEELNAGEDHVVARMAGGSLDIASFKFTGFQLLSIKPDANGGEFIFRAPAPGEHPLFGGFQNGGDFTTVQIQNVPDEIILTVDTAGGNIVFDTNDDANASAGKIDFYQGPLPGANDRQTATRLVIPALPELVKIHWEFGVEQGGVWFDSTQEFETLFLTQDADFRVAAAMALKELHLGYDIDLFSFEEVSHFAGIPIEWELLAVKAGIDNDAAGFGENIDGNVAKPDVSGFIGLYEYRTDVSDLNDGTQSDGGDYVPLVTGAARDCIEASLEVSLTLDPTDFGATFYPLDLNFTPKVIGQGFVDFWANEGVSFGVDLTDTPVPDLGLIEFRNDPDYIDNSPIHLAPLDGVYFSSVDPRPGNDLTDVSVRFHGFHEPNDHFDPFA